MNRNKKLINLQLLAYNTNVTTDSGMSPEMKTYYDKELIRLAKAKLIHDQFADTRDIPKGGGKVIEFRSFDPLPKALTPLTEGVTPDGLKATVKYKTAEVSQYGSYLPYSDVLSLTTIDPVILEFTRLNADQAGRTLDTITRDAINAGTQVNYSGGRLSRSAIQATDTLTIEDLEFAAALLKGANTPELEGGGFAALCHPYVIYDLRRSSEFIEWHKYARPDELYYGEVGRIGNVRLIDSTEAKIWNDDTCPVISEAVPAAGTTPAQPAVYRSIFSTLVVGAHAYATTKVTGGGLQQIVKPIGSGDDPLNQRGTIGWKAIKTAEILTDAYMIRIESASKFSERVTAPN